MKSWHVWTPDGGWHVEVEAEPAVLAVREFDGCTLELHGDAHAVEAPTPEEEKLVAREERRVAKAKERAYAPRAAPPPPEPPPVEPERPSVAAKYAWALKLKPRF